MPEIQANTAVVVINRHGDPKAVPLWWLSQNPKVWEEGFMLACASSGAVAVINESLAPEAPPKGMRGVISTKARFAPPSWVAPEETERLAAMFGYSDTENLPAPKSRRSRSA